MKVPSWGCLSGNYTAPEFTYTFQPDCSGKAMLTVLKDGAVGGTLDVAVGNGNKGCGGENCTAYGLMAADAAVVTFEVTKDAKYLATVDGFGGAKGKFTLTTACACITTEKGLCANGVDDDGDGKSDCGDADCLDEPQCCKDECTKDSLR